MNKIKYAVLFSATVLSTYAIAQTAPSGGNVVEMPDKSLFVSMAGVYSKIFLVNLNKEIQNNLLPFPDIYKTSVNRFPTFGVPY